MNGTTRAVLSASVLLVVLTGSLVIYTIGRTESANVREPDLVPFINEMSALVRANLSSLPSEDIERSLESAIPELAGRVIEGVEGYTVNIFDVDVRIRSHDLPLEVPNPPMVAFGKDGYFVNSPGYGSGPAIPLVPVRDVLVDCGVRLEPVSDGDKVFTNISFSVEVIDPELVMESMIDTLRERSNGYGSDLARDVEYMLNTLARIRAQNLIGWRNDESQFNVLNEGDVELVINIALALRIASLTGSAPNTLVSLIDSYFALQRTRPVMNPTGYRYWSESEKDNFDTYASLSGPISMRRTIQGLIQASMERGSVDPADLLARYLYLERLYDSADNVVSIDPDFNLYDDKGALEETWLVNPRQPQTTVDAWSLEHVVGFPGPEGIALDRRSGTDGEVLELHPYIDLSSGYAVSARDIRIEGLGTDDLQAWYTEVDLSRSPDSLVNRNITPSVIDTRCGGVVPPEKPPSHDYRMQWDLDIGLSVDLFGSLGGWAGNVLDTASAERTLDVSFPVRVLAWYDDKPANDQIEFELLYDTIDLSTPDISGWIIPPEANATEYFEEYAFQSLRGGLSTLTSIMKVVRSVEGPVHHPITRENIQIALLHGMDSLGDWTAGLTLDQLDYIWNLTENHLRRGSLVPFIEPIRIDGLVIELAFSQVNDRLDITFSMPLGHGVLSIQGILVPPMSFTSTLYPMDGTRIDLDISKRSFYTTYTIGADQIREGPAKPSPPTKAVEDLVLRTDWEVTGPVIDIEPAPVGYPHETATNPSASTANMSIIMRGGPASDPKRAMNEARALIGSADPASYARAIPSLLALSRTGEWVGIRMYQSSEGSALSRTLWLRYSGDDLNVIAKDPWTMTLYGFVRWGTSPDHAENTYPGLDILIETAYPPGAALSGDFKVFHQLSSSEGTRSNGLSQMNVFSGGSSIPPTEWTVNSMTAPSPLW